MILRVIDRTFSVLLIALGVLHAVAVNKFYIPQPHARFWALSETLLVFLLAAINLLRTDRPADRGLAWVATGASISYIGFSIAFGLFVNDIFDIRTLIFGGLSLGLTLFGLRTALGLMPQPR